MNKYKIVKNQGALQLIIKGQKGQQLSEREIYVINNNQVGGLIHLNVERKGMTFELIYNLSGFRTLRDYLNVPLNKSSFTALMKNILKSLGNVQEAYFNTQRIMFEFDKVLVSPNDNQLFFIYIPIQGYDTETSLRDFLLNIIKIATFAPGEDRDYIKQYIRILNSGINFSLFDLEEYIRSLSNEQNQGFTKKQCCPQCGNELGADSNFCPNCGYKIISTNVPEPPKNQIYNPLNNIVQSRTEVVKRSYLMQTSTRQKWYVEQNEMLVGKDIHTVQIVIVNNTAISRRHAKVVKKANKIYLVDLNSTNKTYVNGYPIPANVEVELKVHDKIIFANEEFLYEED